jgi:uncharacterized protein YyaL (SSP411 family)
MGAPTGPAWSNRLVTATSPYLLQHAHNPVDWYPWGEEAFETARSNDRPIFLSIGYAACHWCHVMEHESFANPLVAAFLNSHFVPVKVDREERPDVDALYIQALLTINGTAGWPASLFLLPDLRPFTGATYLPPRPRYGLPSFRQVLQRISADWRRDRSVFIHAAEHLAAGLAEPPVPSAAPAALEWSTFVRATIDDHDPAFGGAGIGQKFPRVPELEAQLIAATAAPPARLAVRRTLDAIDQGGLHDHLGGGFHRYCVDRDWTVPHFEKMLYDNAQLLRVFARSGRAADRRTATTLAAYLLTDLRLADGTFASSEDADDSGGEGHFYTFTAAEAAEALPPGTPLPYGITAAGNFEGRTVLTTRDGPPPDEVRARLLLARAARDRPALDDKRVVSWNGLTIGALATAGRLLDEPAWVHAAADCASAVLDRVRDGVIRNRTLSGATPAVLDDYALLADGLLDLYQAQPWSPHWLDAALALTLSATERYMDPAGGYFTAQERPDLIARRKEFVDGAEPSGNGRMASVLLRLLAYGAPVRRRWLDSLLQTASHAMVEQPTAHPELWSAVHALGSPPLQLVIAGSPDHATTRAMLAEWNRTWRPHAVVAVLGDEMPSAAFTLFEGKRSSPDGPVAYLCRSATCSAPISTASALRDAL